MTNASYTIFQTNPDQDLPVCLDDSLIVITKQTRQPTMYWSVKIAMPDTSTVPEAFRPFVDACLALNAEEILYKYVTDPKKTKEFIPADLFSFDALTSASTSTRITAESLIKMWRASAFFKNTVTFKRNNAAAAGDAKTVARIDAAVTRNEERLKGLCVKKIENMKLSSKDMDSIMINLAVEDLDTPMGTFIAERIDAGRKLLDAEPDAI